MATWWKYAALLLVTATACAQTSGTFELVGKFQGIGNQLAVVVGPGPSPGSERFYASYIYKGNTLDILSIDPETGYTEVFPNPAEGESGAWGLTVGPDGNVYVGTLPFAHLLKLDPKRRTIIDLGRPTTTEQYIFDIAFGSDNRLYGATYPNCKLVRYDPATERLEDLGRLDSSELYAHSIVTSKDGFVYAGVGPSKANIAAYEIRTGQRREILPQDAQVAEFPKVFHGADGNVYATVGKREFRLSQWNATELEPENTVPAAPRNALRDGRTLSLALKNGVFTLTVTNPATHNQVEHTIAYRGHELPVFRIGFGPDAVLYGSSYMPAAFSKADFNRHRMEEIGAVGNGEVYSFLSKGERLLMAAYGGMAVLMSYQPEGPFHPAAVSGNPVLIPVEKGDLGWRPMAMLDGPDGNVYVGVVAGYGQLEAPLLVWNVEANSVQRYEDIVHDQGIVSLAAWHDLIIGGTSINGGGGSHPTQNNAKLFIWDPKTRQKEFEIVPLSGAKSITDLIKAPNDMVYGIADNTLFEFNPAARKITKKKTLPFSNLIYNSVSVDHDGRIWGLAKDGIFMIDTTTFRASLVARSPVPITGGFASKDGKIYFISGTAVYSYKM